MLHADETTLQVLKEPGSPLPASRTYGYTAPAETQTSLSCCTAHARKKFDEALHTLPKEQQQTSKPAEALYYFAKLFELEKRFADMTAEERCSRRLEQEKPVLEALFVWANELRDKTAPRSALGKALHYLLEQRPYLERFWRTVGWK
ncbi:MAG: transposase [Eubacteriales bacterium]|nr:transposase [Eubacteriales bacterium]